MIIAFIYTETDRWALGIRSVSAFLKRAGHTTRLLLTGPRDDLCSENALLEIGDLVKDIDVIGLSCFSRGSDKAKQIADYLHTLGKFIIWGGIHATLNAEECSKSADVVCRGEGEGMMVELLDRLAAAKEWRDIDNAVYQKDSTVVMNQLRPLIEDLDGLPVPDYSFSDEHHLTEKGFVRITDISAITEPIMFIGSRGCYYNCTYCSNTKMKEIFAGTGKYVRKMSIGKYIEQAKALRDSFPKSTYYYFIDEDFFARGLEEMRQFAEEYSSKIGMPFDVLASPLRTTPEKMDILVKAGLWRVRMGIESGSERTKKEIYNRPMSNEAVKRAALAINKHPQVVSFFFVIISNPYEKSADLVDTIRFLTDLPSPYFMQAFDLVFFPGSVLYDRAVRDGIISGKQDSGYRIDYRGGLHHKAHKWKKKNLYLNGLLYLMEGKSSQSRLGLLPRRIVPYLVRDKAIRFHDRHPFLIKAMISLKMFMLRLRKVIARMVTILIGDPQIVYNLKAMLKMKLKRA
jgi:anaerobic magnesium-protoporphyrin IX monomethyl ester cyclase